MSKYSVRYEEDFKKSFSKLDKSVQHVIKAWIEKNLVDCEDPRSKGKGLTSNRSGQWRYRIGDYRLLCEIEDSELVIVAVDVGHRSKIYKNKR